MSTRTRSSSCDAVDGGSQNKRVINGGPESPQLQVHNPDVDEPSQLAPRSLPEKPDSHARQDSGATESSTSPVTQRWLSESKLEEPWNAVGSVDVSSSSGSSAKADWDRPLGRANTA
ncbi:MAG: hypothetical protein L6R35_006652 [Caloplaca aegaea]|nr:MAG: hypothetical protein L6R35_006652 [Caloplaca aegaea]